jgi:serine/threonine-protein kinase
MLDHVRQRELWRRDATGARERACTVGFDGMSLQGRILGRRYALGPMLGTGGMASVYKATDLVLRRTVAVKVLHFPYDRDPTFVTRFRHEARIVAGLSHPNIVAVFDTGTDDDLHYIVMEYVDGENLAAMMDREGPLAPATASRIAWSVCQALTAAHERGLVHRDIKPGNVIVSQAGAVKVTDFGIAKAMAATTASLAGTGSVLGTASYMSPEQAQGQPVDERSDLYSLGCVLYELLTGKPPFVNDTAVGLVWQHVAEDPEPLAGRHPDVGEGLAAVVGKALAKHPDDRYPSAQAMGEDLERVVAGLAPAGARSGQRPSGNVVGAPASAGMPALGAGPAAAGAAISQPGLGRTGWALLAGLVVALLLLLAVLLAVLRGGGSPAGAERAQGAGPTSPPPSTSATATTVSAAATTATTGTSMPSTTAPTGTTSPTTSAPPPTVRSLPAALADLTEVLTGGVMAGTVDPRANEELVNKAQDVVKAIQDGHDDDARKKLRELDQNTEELIAAGEIGPTAAGPVRQAVAEFTSAAERSMTPPDSG